MSKKILFFAIAAIALTACQSNKQVMDYSVFDDAYYYMSTAERDSVWALIPADTLEANPQYRRMHEAFLMEQQTAVGGQYIDFRAKTPAGEELALSDLVGKTDYVLIDFWASWCPPCRALMPVLKTLYVSFPDGKLEIVGVSLDDNAEQWMGAIERLDLPWRHMSDLLGWGCEPANTYGVFCIPTLVLIDRNGTIVARGCDEEYVLSQIK